MTNKCTLSLVQAPGDDAPFGVVYQRELAEYSRQVRVASNGEYRQRGFAMDGAVGGGGSLGEFVIESLKYVCPVISAVAAVYIKSKLGRKVSVKIGNIKIEASTIEEVSALLEKVNEFQDIQ